MTKCLDVFSDWVLGLRKFHRFITLHKSKLVKFFLLGLRNFRHYITLHKKKLGKKNYLSDIGAGVEAQEPFFKFFFFLSERVSQLSLKNICEEKNGKKNPISLQDRRAQQCCAVLLQRQREDSLQLNLICALQIYELDDSPL